MSRLISNILKNRQQDTLSEVDMSRSGTAMLRHLGVGFPYDEETSVPIEPVSSAWTQKKDSEKSYLSKTYDLQSAKFLIYFVNELINLSEAMYHHPEILIDHFNVSIKLYTKDINDVTDKDIEMSKKVDEIFEDINVINFRN